MPFRHDQTLVFIHGVGGALPEEKWLAPLSDAMAQQGHSRPEASGTNIVTIDYRAALLSSEAAKLPRTVWRKPEDLATHHADYQARRAEFGRVIRSFQQVAPRAGLSWAGEETAYTIAQLAEVMATKLRTEARRYRSGEDSRAAVLAKVLSALPQTGRLVIAAHSLGSVVAVDVIKRLPDGVVVDLLITMGSPLPLKQFWPFIDLTGSDFPYDKIRAWTNVFDSLDPVSVGRGIGEQYPEATDVDVHFGSLARHVKNHQAEYYLSLPVIGALIGTALNGSPTQTAGSETNPARQLGKDWDLYLLSAAYALQASATCDSRKLEWRRRFDAARRASIAKLLADADEHASSLPESALEVPTEADLLDHATGLIKKAWSDGELVPLAVAMLMSSPVKPYEVSISNEHAEIALTSLLNRVRREDSALADQVFAKAVADALKEAREAMGGTSKLWAYLLLGGAVVLGLTGVGVWAAAPAGLAGAALITSTLAAFGPGGMVGGMVTIAAASSAGSALLSAGVTSLSQEESRASASFATSVAKLPKEQLRATVTGWIASIIAEEKLSFGSSIYQVRALLSASLVEVVNEENTHRGLKSAGAKEWEERREILERAIGWLDKTHPSAVVQIIGKALAKAAGPLTIDATQLQRPEPPMADSPKALGYVQAGD